MNKITKEQGAILSAFTGIMCGNLSDFHEYAEKIMERPIWTHEFGNSKFAESIKEASRKDFLSIMPDNE